jgi:hypothetical protein
MLFVAAMLLKYARLYRLLVGAVASQLATPSAGELLKYAAVKRNPHAALLRGSAHAT